MSEFKVINEEGSFEIEVKRFYLPVKIEANCPECGEHVVYDLNDNYLSYPDANVPFGHTMYCECEHEWEVPVILRVTMEAGEWKDEDA